MSGTTALVPWHCLRSWPWQQVNALLLVDGDLLSHLCSCVKEPACLPAHWQRSRLSSCVHAELTSSQCR